MSHIYRRRESLRRISVALALICLVSLAVLPNGSLSRTTISENKRGSWTPAVKQSSSTHRLPNYKQTAQARINEASGEAPSRNVASSISPSSHSKYLQSMALALAPSISSISPSSPTASGSNQNVTVFGSGFQQGLTVGITFPGGGGTTLSGAQIQSVTTTSFVMVVTLNGAGTWSIRVNNPDGGQSNKFFFTVQASQPPSISSISPSSPTRKDSNQNLSVSGSGFQSGLTVTVFIPGGGTSTLSGTQIQSVASSSFTMVVTLNVVGTYGIRVNNPDGGQSNTFNFAVQNPVSTPQINSISPATPMRRDNDQNIVVNGSGFQSGLTVTVFIPGGGTSTLSGTQIQTVPSASFTMVITLNLTGQYGIRVNNPDGGQSNVFNFNVQNPVSTPQISSISPAGPTRRDTDQNVSVTGSGFQSGLTVTVFIPGGGASTLSGTQIQNVTGASFTLVVTLNVAGTYGIRVNNPDGGQSNTFNFQVQNPVSSPQITSVSPSSPTRKDGDQNVSVSGSSFQAGLTVTVTIPGGGTSTLSGAQILNVTNTSFTMVITLNVTGQYSIRVNNPDGGQSSAFNFTVQNIPAAAPTINSISPTNPISSSTDQNVTVFGSNFQQNLTVNVTFPGGGGATLSGTQIQSVTSTSFVMRITFAGAGTWGIRVNNPDGGQSSIFNFTVQSVIQAPSISSINPSSPSTSSTDQDIAVFGSNFQPNLTVSVTFPGGGGTTLSGTQIQNVTSSAFVLRITLGATGNWSIRVNNPDSGQSSVFNFNVAGGGQNPVISSINPATPITNGADQNVIVNGSNFQLGLIVNVSFPNGGVATLQGTGQIQNVTGNSFLMRITLNAAGNWTIRVVNPNGTQSGQFSFNVQASGPPPSNLPTSVLSPVIGPLRMSNQGIRDGKWAFNQHQTGAHTPTGGISLSNDTFAWDVNLYTETSGNADAGKAVFAVADGEVVSYVGTPPGGGPGAVLIAHPNRSNPIWFSGYLHMTNVRVSLNQQVNVTTVVGEIGRDGADNDHLHFVVYSGQNTRGNLHSFNATVIERSMNAANPPTISLIEPQTVNQSSTPQLVTINGANFQSNSIIEGQAPSRQSFTVTSETISGLGNEAKIVNITPSSITALINFPAEGTYEFSVINRPSSNPSNLAESSFAASNSNSGESLFAVSGSNTVRALPSGRTPVILIPGILGSRIGKRQPNGGFRELWLAGLFNDNEHRELASEVEDPSNYKPISARNVVATEILRAVGTEILRDSQFLKKPPTNVYGKLIDYLTGPGVGYTLYDVQYPTVSPCDLTRTDADLFLFPYDWRNSNFTSARDLWNYVQCIKRIRGNPPDFKVHIIAHSMGGLVARRYILSNPGTHHVERMVTLGTPWLGAPTSINIMETGNYGDVNKVINTSVLKQIAPFIRGAHELIPSKAYDDDLDHLVLGEDGWNDFDTLPPPTRWFDFNGLKTAMNLKYHPPGRPGDNTHTFHSQEGQDNWHPSNLFRVDYYNFVGFGGSNTIGTLVARKNPAGKNELAPFPTSGDGTVPLASALRYRGNRPGLPNYSGGIKREVGFNLDHSGLASNGLTFPFIMCVVNVPDADACINRLQGISSASSIKKSEELTTQQGDFIGEPNYFLKMIGSHSVIISDSFGNTTNPLSTSVDEGVRTVQTDVTGDTYLSATFPLDQNYRVVLRSPATPVSILLTKSDGQTITQAVRYVDITLPPNVLALLEITPQSVTLLKYDSDGDGTFDMTVQPTASVVGLAAQDVTPPDVAINATPQGSSLLVTIAATDSESGVKTVHFSQDGVNFATYTGPFTVNPLQGPVVFAFADDKVANRSGVATYYPSSTANQIDNAQFFVRQHYADFLNREPDAGGLAFWTDGITSCGGDQQCVEVKRINTSAAFYLSIEFQETGYLAYRAYKAAFGNIAGKPVPITREEMLSDMRGIGEGVVVGVGDWEQRLEQNKQAYFNQLAAREKFTTLYPQTMTPEQFVDALNTNAGRALSQAERDALVNDLKNNTKTRAQVLRVVAEDADLVRAETNKAFVLMQYYGYLRRNPDDAPDTNFDGWQFWLSKLNQFNGNFVQAEMVRAFILSVEYRQRFGQ